MGLHTTHEALALRWAELCNDPLVRDLPGKVELNAYGVIELSPASNRHGRFQATIAHQLIAQLADGVVLTECSVATDEGVRVPDVAWASATFAALHGDTTPFARAPELCIEILSRSNTRDEMELKTRAYLAAGAVEVWLVGEDGTVRIHDATGAQPASRWPVTLKLA